MTLAVLVTGCTGRDSPGPTDAAIERLGGAALASAVDLRMTGCRSELVRGAGAVIDRRGTTDYILTAAHVVAGATSITVRRAGTNGDERTPGVLLAIDPFNDVALVAVDGLRLPALTLALEDLAVGEQGVAVIVHDELAVVQPYTVVNPAIVNIRDIYDGPTVARAGYRLAIEIAPGDSGAVLIDSDGRAAGVLYAKTRGAKHQAFATNTSAIAALLEAAQQVDVAAGIDPGE
ncbi:MAG: serine protease, partial [Ilumatobacteraceae bacterium]